MAEIANVSVGGVDGKKYQFVIHDDAQAFEAYRHGERWPAGEEYRFNNSVQALILRVAELEQHKREAGDTSPEVASLAGRVLAAGNPLYNEQVVEALYRALDQARQDKTGIVGALRPILQPYLDNMTTLAASCLAQRAPNEPR